MGEHGTARQQSLDGIGNRDRRARRRQISKRSDATAIRISTLGSIGPITSTPSSGRLNVTSAIVRSAAADGKPSSTTSAVSASAPLATARSNGQVCATATTLRAAISCVISAARSGSRQPITTVVVPTELIERPDVALRYGPLTGREAFGTTGSIVDEPAASEFGVVHDWNANAGPKQATPSGG